MPGDGMRYVRDAVGVEAVVVNGEVAWAAGAYTEARAGVVCELT
jgi:N-acyl-D-amino-acid deacylase